MHITQYTVAVTEAADTLTPLRPLAHSMNLGLIWIGTICNSLCSESKVK